MKKEVTPFLKWAGGKRWLIQQYPELFPTEYNTYFEPFLGSGVVFFHIQPEFAVLNDTNKDLIDSYKAIRSRWRKVYTLLSEHHKNHCKNYYYDIRSTSYRSLEERAAKMIYLNRTCFNGIYRVNKKGEFNVPIGSKTQVLLDTDDFQKISKILKGIKLLNTDFEKVINLSREHDFVFVDPPYTVRHNSNGFVKYNEVLFSWEDQERLAQCLIKAKNRGVKILMTNAAHPSIRQLYEPNGFNIKAVSRYSSISANKKSRSNYQELLIFCNL
ncbi:MULTISPECIES: DNA adenine methylase [Bacillus amyloliquefaciens group]|uniref:DNA adenine methylase n=1 Tax=Bacillus amyloliquefaciens group TaxID=1938374 RepID=UPI002281DCD1|nr:Dam family site-specific DNA-(adenine-N6)-methyltransferase [Bacillus velezensis]MCY7442010.1 Dam family site-specific DNA-(adenine-N6)-methyltransferase [Bacillus velezensis]